jgi:hypothetical protein
MIQFLDSVKINEFDCLEPNKNARFYYQYEGIMRIIEVQEGSRICNKKTLCFFRDKQLECNGFACRATERADEQYVIYKDVTDQAREEMVRDMMEGD